MDLQESELVRRCCDGDPEAWEALFSRHYTPAAHFVFQLAPDFTREDVEEICQEVFLSVVRNLGTFKFQSQLQTWIFRIAANKARDFREKRGAAKRGSGAVPISLQAEDPETGLTLDPPSSAKGPDELLLADERGRMVAEAVHQLGDPCREIIQMRYFAELSYEEIGKALNLNLKTVSSRLSKCLDQLELLVRGRMAREENEILPSNQ